MIKKYFILIVTLFCATISWAAGPVTKVYDYIYDPGELKPIDSQIKVKKGELAPDFSLPAINGEMVKLSSYRGKSNVVLSFVPAAWTPVCSGQWPGYNIIEQRFKKNDAILLGITVDNKPTLHAWTLEMGGLWFEVLSDFYPHGAVAEQYGLLRSDGTAERALIFINKEGVITEAKVSDINLRPPLEYIFQELDKFTTEQN